MTFPTTRPRRLRANHTLRRLVAETRVTPDDLIYPAFVVPGKGVAEPIGAMPGICHYSADNLAEQARAVYNEGIGAMLLFGVPDKKDEKGSGAYDKDGVVQRAIAEMKSAAPDLLVITDVCLCAYTSHGHCGVTDSKGRVLNDPSLELISKMALSHANAGADIVAPSDMMDGRVAAIRAALDAEGLEDTTILSYSAKYASCFYGPFRDAAHSAPQFGDRKTYQMDPPNAREALKEIALDIDEGADMVMVKPALPYLDVIARARDCFDVPIAAYQVSGEYSMIKAASEKGWIDEKRAMNESLTAIRRAGADLILTYFARDFARSFK
jgi:porphobilinogen synthase